MREKVEGASSRGDDRIRDKINMKAPGPALGDSGDTQWAQYPGCQGSPAGRLEPSQAPAGMRLVAGPVC